MQRTLHLVRHGKVHNPKDVIYGRLPGFKLSELGQRQARSAAEYLAHRDVTSIWSSPLERAQETAEIIAEPHGLPVVTEERLIESGTTLEGVGRNLWAFVSSPRVLWRIRNPLGPSWGEKFSEIRGRVVEVVWEAIEKHPSGELVFVMHQTPVQAARLALARSNRPPWLGDPCATGSVSTLTLEGDAVVSSSYFVPPQD